MLMADNNSQSQNWSFDEVLPDDDRLCIDIESLLDMIGDTPESSENKPEVLPVKMVSQELEGQSLHGVELLGSETCCHSYNSETSDSRTRSSEGSIGSAAKHEPSVENAFPVYSLSGSLPDWISSDIPLEVPDYPVTYDFPAVDNVYISDVRMSLDPNHPSDETDYQFKVLEEDSEFKGLRDNGSMENSDSSHGTYLDSDENTSQFVQALHMNALVTGNSGLSLHEASHTRFNNHELLDTNVADLESHDMLESYNQFPQGQYPTSVDSPLYTGPLRQRFHENFGIQSAKNNVARVVNIKNEEMKLESGITGFMGTTNFKDHVERAGVVVSATSAMDNSDVIGLNNECSGAEYVFSSFGISSNSVNFNLRDSEASQVHSLPHVISNMSGKKQVCVKDEKNNELYPSQGTECRFLKAVDNVSGRMSSGAADGYCSKKQAFHTSSLGSQKRAFHVKDDKHNRLFVSQGTECQSSINMDGVADQKSFGVAGGVFADEGMRQPHFGIFPSIPSENQVVMEDQIDGMLIAANRDNHYLDEDETCTKLFSDVQHQDVQFPKQLALQANSIRQQVIPRHVQSNSTVSQLSRVGEQVIEGSPWVDRCDIDDDSDICILEDLSAPVRQYQSSVNVNSYIASQSSTFIDSRNRYEVGGIRLKTDDEKFVFRAALQDLSQPKSEATPPDGFLSVPLLRHQRIALSWMVQKETNSLHCSGGILADDQGLGKTISTIALILKERSPSSRPCSINIKQMETLDLDNDDGGTGTELCGTTQGGRSCESMTNKSSPETCNSSVQAKGRPAAGTLIVCPTSVLRQWSEELHNKVTSKANLSVLTYHGANRTKDPLEMVKYDVVLTTYAIVSMEVPKQPLVDKDDDETGRQSHIGHPSTKKRKYAPTSDKRSLKSKKGDNELSESVARPLAQVRWFRIVLDEAQSIKNHRTQVARACWGLRAKRRWCLSGTPIQNSIDDLYSYFRFLRYDPYAIFKSFCSTIKVPIQKNPTNGYKKLQAVLKTIMLRRTKGTLLDGEPIINLPPKTIELKKVEFTMEERDFYCQLEADSRAQFAEYAAAGTVKENYVNILLMLLRLRQACDHPLLVRRCGSSSLWTSSFEVAKKLPPEKQVSLLNCLEASLAICGICNDPPEDAVVTSCGHVFCNQCICDHLTGDDNQCPTTKCKARLTLSSVFSRATLRGAVSKGQENSADCSGSVLSETLQPCSSGGSFDSSKIKAALEVLQTLSRPRDKPDGTPKNNSLITTDGGVCWPENLSDPLPGKSTRECCNNQSSSLNNSTSNLVPSVGEKAIVFSQWTRMLDLLEACLKDSSIKYRRLDGTMSVVARDKAVKDFNTQPEVSVIIMSLKAASLGLNMVAACHVLLLDLWWNPTTEDQAIDRAHRIGQTRPVSVLRLTVKDTVEDRILALQQKKRLMVASAFGEDQTGSRQTRLTVEDLKYLFMYN